MKNQILILLIALSIRSFGQSFTVSVSTNPDYCSTCVGSATAIPTDTCHSGYKYFWNNGQTTQTISSLCAGTYTVTVLCDTSKAMATANIGEVPALHCAMANIHNDTTGQGSGSLTVNVIAGPGPYTYAWNTTPVQTTQTAVNLKTGTYTVTVVGQFGCACSCNGTVASTNSINEMNNDLDISIFPNPTSGIFSIDFSKLNEVLFNIELSDITGRLVYSQKIINTTNKISAIDISGLARGIYYLRLYNKDTNIKRKILKE